MSVFLHAMKAIMLIEHEELHVYPSMISMCEPFFGGLRDTKSTMLHHDPGSATLVCTSEFP